MPINTKCYKFKDLINKVENQTNKNIKKINIFEKCITLYVVAKKLAGLWVGRIDSDDFLFQHFTILTNLFN